MTQKAPRALAFIALAFLLSACNDNSPEALTKPAPIKTEPLLDASKSVVLESVEPNADRIASFAPVYTVSEYDPMRDAARDLAATVKQAKVENKRIILEIGGQW